MRTAIEPSEPEGMNMTPMIDVVFQLIIFFMLVTDMTNRQVEKMKLPAAARALVGEPATLVVNVRKDGTVAIDGKVFVRPGPDPDTKRLDDLFAIQEAMGKPVTVHVRADRSSEWQWVQLVMQSATAHGKATRVDFGAAMEPR